MYIGHVGATLLAKHIKKDNSILLFFIAAIGVDIYAGIIQIIEILFPLPIDIAPHSILSTLTLAALFGILVFIFKNDMRLSLFTSAIVISHTLFDYITTTPFLWNNGPAFGMNLYKRPWLSFVVEVLFLFIGWWFYRENFTKSNKRWALNFLFFLMVFFQLIYTIML